MQDFLTDPVKFQQLCWPHIRLYDKQVEILYSLRDNDETFVPAGNGLGKDFVAGLAVLWFFCSRRPCRVVTSSVDGNQLEAVLWGEIRRFISTSRFPLPILENHLYLRQKQSNGTAVPNSYCIGRVVKLAEGMLGHHLPKASDGTPRTLVVFDEASAIMDEAYNNSDTWAHRKLVIGNCYPTSNFFYQGVKAGDLKSPKGYYRKVIRITGEDSPNVRFSRLEEKKGETTHTVIIPGVLDRETYDKRRLLWDNMRQCIGLDAMFYEGQEVKLFPDVWLTRAKLAKVNPGMGRRVLGIDVAEGGDDTCWTVINETGILFLEAIKTPDTSIIYNKTRAIQAAWGVRDEDTFFDRGGGGKQHADYLRSKGHNVNTIGFGEAATDPRILSRARTIRERLRDAEQRYVYKNRRAEMYGLTRLLLDPLSEKPFGIPAQYAELHRQLKAFPLMFDSEGRMMLPPKNKSNAKQISLIDVIGCSPDEADSLVLAVFGLMRRSVKREARVFA